MFHSKSWSHHLIIDLFSQEYCHYFFLMMILSFFLFDLWTRIDKNARSRTNNNRDTEKKIGNQQLDVFIRMPTGNIGVQHYLYNNTNIEVDMII